MFPLARVNALHFIISVSSRPSTSTAETKVDGKMDRYIPDTLLRLGDRRLRVTNFSFVHYCRVAFKSSIQRSLLGSSVRLQIQEVTEVMRENVQKVMERGDKLEDLQEASDRLNSAGNEFRSAAKKAQQRAWFQNFRARIILVTITMTVVICIIGTMFNK